MSTNCIFPPELDDKQLLAYLDDPDANQETASHIEKCSYCRGKAEALDRFQKDLKSRLYRSTCPPPEELGEFHLKMLPASRRLVIGQHLRACHHCTREISNLTEYLSDREPQPNILESVQEFIAHLVSGGEVAFHSMRGDEDRTFTYQADGLFFSINVDNDMEQPGRKTVLGWIEGLSSDGFTMEAYQEGNLIATTFIDEIGNFVFTHLVPGNYDLVLPGPQTKVRLVPPLSVF